MPKNVSPADSLAPLIGVLQRKVLPWMSHWDTPRIVVARTSVEALTKSPKGLPAGVKVSLKKRQGRRVATRSSRAYGFAINTARWPEDGLVTSRLPVIACIIGGVADLQVGDYILHCSEGNIVLLPSGVPYPDGSRSHLEGANLESGSCDVLWCYPWGDGLIFNMCHSRCRRHWTLDHGENCLVLNQQAVMYLGALMEEASAGADSYEQVCHALLSALFTVLLRELKAGRFLQPGVAIDEAPAALDGHDPIVHAQEYIRSHLNQPLTIDAVARLSYMSRAQFTKRFRQVTGKSFIVFLTDERLAAAKTMLRDTELSISMIGHFVGLKPPHLRRLFSTQCGMSPSIFRRQSRRVK